MDLRGFLFNAVITHVEQSYHIAIVIDSLDAERPVKMKVTHPALNFIAVKTILPRNPLNS